MPDEQNFVPAINTSESIFAVADVRATVRFYREVLGFTNDWLWEDPPTFGGVSCGKVQVMFCQQNDLAAKVEGHQHMFRCEDVAGLYHQHIAAGAMILSPLENKPWGLGEYTVKDPNGYHLRFAGQADFKKPANALASLPANVRIVHRLPALDEYMMLTKAVGFGCPIEVAQTGLANSLFGVVAVEVCDDREKAIGSIRVIGDRARFFYLQDVMVLPEYQNRRVGAAMMEVVVTWLRQNAPKGSYVQLFTGKHAFYERFGFVCDHGGMTLRL
jgi:GNAT superfamily N-acetyltransferase